MVKKGSKVYRAMGGEKDMVEGEAFTFVDLFAGMGGFHHALSSLGGECVWACDIDPDSKTVHETVWPDMVASGKFSTNIRLVTQNPDGSDRSAEDVARLVPDHDVLCGGFPCQPFSLAGKQLGVMDKTRGTLFHDILAIVRAKKPRYVMLENVKNLVSKNHTDTWRTIVESLRAEGYSVPDRPVVLSPHMLAPQAGGRPQNRERVFILAQRCDSGDEKHTPQIRIPAKADYPQWKIEDYLLDDTSIANIDDYRLSGRETIWLETWNELLQTLPDDDLPGTFWVEALTDVLPEGYEQMSGWRKHIFRTNRDVYVRNQKIVDKWLTAQRGAGVGGCTVKDFPPSRQKLEWQARSAQPKAADRDLWKLVIQFRQSGVRVKPATHLPALVAIVQTSVIGSRRRRITPVEAGRMQGFPDTVFPTSGLADSDAYRLAGNAVNVGVVTFLAEQLVGKAPLPSSDVGG